MITDGPSSNALSAARSRYEEHELAAAIATGATQYVVLGAGAPAVRKIDPRLRVFEVDQHTTDDQSLSVALENTGFQANEISFFSWLGSTLHRTAEAVIETLAFVGSQPAGSSLVFEYTVERSSLDSVKQFAMDALASRIGKAGELRLFLNPSALYGLLRAAGFHRIEDLGPEDIYNRYFGRGPRLEVSAAAARLVTARV